MKVDGSVAIITGASSGFGLALADRLVGKGAKVVLGDIAEPAGKALQDSLNKRRADSAIFVKCDVTKKADVVRLFDVAKERFGQFDIVVNNAGIAENKHFAADHEDSWIKVVDINLTAVILGTRVAITEFLSAKRKGVILNTASLAGLYPQPGQPVYAATKGGVVHFTRSFNVLGAQKGIRVNAICPSFSPTNIVKGAIELHGQAFEKAIQKELVPVETVIDAFVKGIEDETLAGACIRVTAQNGIDVYRFRKTPKL
ncbi:hypothetical protein HK097_004838 [Rhizophlyctis rosea]|uniref:15-hydroxyprostaglandin dehydrogenase n=1 Tax=Rhizophlyctis rosea TaxID=64517 RepID=A0AAD5S8C4_9FUNG|nr:hypothetical protein HK097_004838 [Rhizophlyctis rosea]